MVRWTTPTFTLTVKNVNLTGYQIYVTIKQGESVVTIDYTDVTLNIVAENSILSFTLSQQDSAKFDFRNKANVQVNAINSDNHRVATDIMEIDILANLIDKEIEYEL